jgi:quinoprotein glucose dehydrogenase
VTGELRFAWDINQPEVTKLPPDGKPYSLGTPNMWTTGVGDEKLGLVYLPMGNSAADYYTSLRSEGEEVQLRTRRARCEHGQATLGLPDRA